MRKFLTVVGIAAAVALAVYCGLNIAKTLQERYLSKTEYENVRDHYVSAFDGEKDKKQKEEEKQASAPDAFSDLPIQNIDANGLLSMNKDYVAWIYYEEGKLNYPVTQVPKDDPEKYLDTTFEGASNPSGCIFMDATASPEFTDSNTFLYGHNMYNETMFGSLKLIYQNPLSQTSPYFYVWTKSGKVIKYRVFADFITDKDSDMYSVPGGDDAYDKYVSKAMTLGADTGAVPLTDEENDALKNHEPILTLSTCYGAAGTPRRLLVLGVKIAEKKVDENGKEIKQEASQESASESAAESSIKNDEEKN